VLVGGLTFITCPKGGYLGSGADKARELRYNAYQKLVREKVCTGSSQA